MRPDKQLEYNQKAKECKKRFKDIYEAFTYEEWKNPVTKESILDAQLNCIKEISHATH